ncbi:MAG: glycoside hydrolase family 13 protein [Clostridiales bacterium]|nr:glycoside hydrolase family 13 protein [Clostridiales bacterium]
MAPSPVFSSRDPRCKQPYGAVPAGTSVQFTLRPLRAEGFSLGELTARFEHRDNHTVTLPMAWRGRDDEEGRDLFSATLETGDYVGLVWYSFRLEGLDGRVRDLGAPRQLTVYDGSEPVPEWFGAGVTYQIFPDRFRRTGIPDPAGMVGGRTVHADWQDEPEYRPDAHGEIRNRDFFGGSLAGILEKLDYLQALGVETLYLCPVFEAAENHRYGTADYEKIDPMLGTEADFSRLCAQAHRRGMRVLLDGVFNHIGFVSKYFNGDGFYPEPGAAQSRQSPYYPWFRFSRWPDRYDAWWGIYSLPAVRESEPSYMDYIIEGEDSIVRRWLRAGADGWRLDVADELPDAFVRALHGAVRAEKPDGVVIGEVWEDGSNKIAYGVRRKHLLGGHCDGLMNYPFRGALLDFLLGGPAQAFRARMEALRENYPPSAFYSAMNILGTHDTVRILTLLGTGSSHTEQSRDWRAAHRLSPEARTLGLARLRLAALVLFAFPGSPTLYYGDEAGMEGFEDPFNRRPFPWGREDQALTAWFSALGSARRRLSPLRRGDIRYLRARGRVLAFVRTLDSQVVLCAVNAGETPCSIRLPQAFSYADALTGVPLTPGGGDAVLLRLPPMTGRLIAGTQPEPAGAQGAQPGVDKKNA